MTGPITGFDPGNQNPNQHQPDLVEQAAELLVRSIIWAWQTCWDFRNLTAPVAVLLAAAIFVHPAALAAVTIVPLPRLRQAAIAEWRTSVERYRHSTWRRRWPTYATQLGWSRTYGRTAHTPKLRALKINPSRTVVELQPLADHRIGAWPEMVDSLRRLTNHAQATWKETTPGHLEITLTKTPLPILLRLNRRKVAESENEIYLGACADGTDLTWDVDHAPHLFVAGATGGGKGSIIRLCLLHAVESNWETVVVNPKRSGEYHWTKTRGVTVLAQLHETEQMLQATLKELYSRQEILDEKGEETWCTQDWSRQLIVVDETPTLLMGKTGKDLRENIAVALNTIAAMGRSAGIHLAIAAQRPDAQTLGPYGGQLRNNITARIAIGTLDQQGRQMLFGTLDPDVIRTLDSTPGRALATQTNSHITNHVMAAQVAYLTQQELKEGQL